MGNESSVKKLTTSGITTLGSCFLYNICINKTLVGTIVIKEGTTTVGTIAAGTLAGNYHQNTNGTRYTNLTITLSTTDDVSVLTRFTS